MLKIEIKRQSLKINIIPLIDIIFLMLVFFMLATNFDKNKQISFSVIKQKEITDKVNEKKLMILYLKDNNLVFNDKKLTLKKLELDYLKKWSELTFDRIVILNDQQTSMQMLISILDLIKKNKIKNVNFSNDTKTN